MRPRVSIVGRHGAATKPKRAKATSGSKLPGVQAIRTESGGGSKPTPVHRWAGKHNLRSASFLSWTITGQLTGKLASLGGHAASAAVLTAKLALLMGSAKVIRSDTSS